MTLYLRRFAITVAMALLLPTMAHAEPSIRISQIMPPYPSAEFPLVWWAPGAQSYSSTSFTITNNGTEYLWGLSVTFAQPQYSLVSHTCGSGLNPGAVCTVNIRYTPAGPGESQYSSLRVGLYPLPYLYDVQLYSHVAAATVPGAATITSGVRSSGDSAMLTIRTPQSDGHSAIAKCRVTAAPVNGCGLMIKEFPCNLPPNASLSVVIDGLAPSVYYYFTVAVGNAVGWGPESAPPYGPL